jgi:hypothetical protein
MPDRVSFLKARYCRAVLKTALNSSEDDARRLVYCLATEPPTGDTSSAISAAEKDALTALAKMAARVHERGVASIASHWTETNAIIEKWIAAAYQIDER